LRVRAGLVAVAALALCLGCPETRAQRGRDALRLVVRMHREICQAEIRQARAFQFRPEITQARHLGFWPRCRVADTEGLLIQRDLLDHYLALRRGARDEDLPERVRQYLAWRADQAQREMAALDQADRIDTTPLDVLVRQGNREICQEQAAIAQKYLTLAEARGRWTGF
jgi:hypothetical protein